MLENLVSIITPLYNTDKFIEDTIKSVLAQSYMNWEMLIIDDCSTDKGPEIVKKYSDIDNRVKYIKMEKNSGAAICRNKGIELARGQFIAFLDSDDLWKKDKLKIQIEFMNKNNFAVSFHEYEEIDEKDNKLGILIKVPKKPITYRKYLLTNPIGCLSGVYSVKKIGKIYMPLLKKRQDTGFWLRVLKKEKYAYPINKNLGEYRVRANSLSAKKSDLIKYHWELYREHEKLSVIESGFYLFTTILTKLLKIKEMKAGLE